MNAELVVRGLSAAPYLVRRLAWADAMVLLEGAGRPGTASYGGMNVYSAGTRSLSVSF